MTSGQLPSVAAVGALLSDLGRLSNNSNDTFNPLRETSGLGLAKVTAAPSFQLLDAPVETSRYLQGDWHGALSNALHKVLRTKARHTHVAIMQPDSVFMRQLAHTPVSNQYDLRNCLSDIVTSLDGVRDDINHYYLSPKTQPFLDRITQHQAQVRALADKQGSFNCADIWGLMLTWQQFYMEARKLELAPFSSLDTLNGTYQPIANFLRETLNMVEYVIISVDVTGVAALLPEDAEVTTTADGRKCLKLVLDKDQLGLPPAHIVLGLFSGKTLLDEARMPKSFRSLLAPIGVETSITEKWDKLNQALLDVMGEQGIALPLAQKILVDNSFTISPSDHEYIQQAARQSLQELEFIHALRKKLGIPASIKEESVQEIKRLAGPVVRSAEPIAETPLQLAVLLERVCATSEHGWGANKDEVMATCLQPLKEVLASVQQRKDQPLVFPAHLRGGKGRLLNDEVCKTLIQALPPLQELCRKSRVIEPMLLEKREAITAALEASKMLAASLEANVQRDEGHSKSASR